MRALYEQTIAFVLQHIDENGLQVGDQLPSETRLAQLAGVSLVTVRRALQELAAKSIVRREQGRGTFVARPRVRAETTRIGGLRNSLHLDARSTLSTTVLGVVAREATTAECGALAVAPGTTVWEISRLRLLNGRPMIWETSTIPRLLAPDLGTQLERRAAGSLYDLLEEHYGLKESREEQSLLSRPAQPRESSLLELLPFEWVVEITGTSYSTRQTPIDFFRMIFAARAFAFRLATVPANGVEAVELS